MLTNTCVLSDTPLQTHHVCLRGRKRVTACAAVQVAAPTASPTSGRGVGAPLPRFVLGVSHRIPSTRTHAAVVSDSSLLQVSLFLPLADPFVL